MWKFKMLTHRRNRWVGKPAKVGTPYGGDRIGVLTVNRIYGISYLPFTGFFVDGVWTREVVAGRAVEQLVETRRRPSMKKVKVKEAAAVKHLAALETEMFSDYMPILEHLALLCYDDGTPRKPGFLMIWTDGAAWRAIMKDNDAKAKLPVMAKTVDDLFDALALLLASEDCPWEPDDQAARIAEHKKRK